MRRKIAQARGVLAGILPLDAELLSVNDRAVRNLGDVLLAVHHSGSLDSFRVILQGATQPQLTTLETPLVLDPSDVAASLQLVATSEVRYDIYPGSAAESAGLVDGCRILRVQDQPVRSFEELRAIVLGLGDNPDASPDLTLDAINPGASAASSFTLQLAPIPYARYQIATRVEMVKVRSASPLQAMRLGFREARSMVMEVFTTVQRMISGEIASKNLGGIITIGTATHSFASQGIIPLLFFLCMISVNLGVLNLLPIPALDGGHILFALLEIVGRRPVSIAVQNVFQVVGVFVILFLLIFVTALDIQRLFS